MYIWLALLFPIVAIIIMYSFFKQKIAWWESSIILLTIISFIAIMKYSTETYQTSDTEYWGDYVVRVEHYDEWDEWIIQTCTRQCCPSTSTDSKGNTTTTYGSETYDCSYRNYHPEIYKVITQSGASYTINNTTYYRLLKQFNATSIFVDMHRNYFTIDGDMQYFEWNNKVESVEEVITTHHYENRIQASTSVLNFPEVDTSNINFYELKNYPNIYNLTTTSLLGDNNPLIDKYINQTNCLYASQKQAKVFYLIFKNKTFDAAMFQEQFWKGGNKNEINICIGIDSQRHIKWAYVFSWTKKEIIKVRIRDYINTQKYLNDSTYKNIINYSNNEIIQNFERRHFKEFSYLTVEPSTTSIIWTFIISLIMSIGLSIWIVKNEFEADGVKYNTYIPYDRRKRY